MKKYFVVTDVHGFYKEMITALNKAGFDINNSNHIFVSLGDLLDRGLQPQQCLDFVNNLPNERKILIRGNHEDLMCQMIHGGNWPRSIDKHNGTWQTARDLTGVDIAEVMYYMRGNKDWRKYYDSTKYYAIIGDNIFVHAWVPFLEGYIDKKYISKVIPIEEWDEVDEYDWEHRYTWQNGMQRWKEGVIIPGKTIYCGHWNCSWARRNIEYKTNNEFDLNPENHKPFKAEGIVAMDACTALTHIVNCEVIEIE